jgi:hypothetical protein
LRIYFEVGLGSGGFFWFSYIKLRRRKLGAVVRPREQMAVHLRGTGSGDQDRGAAVHCVGLQPRRSGDWVAPREKAPPALKGPRVFDASGIPLHEDNETIIQERIYLDKADKNLLHDDITTIDHALTRPWKVTETVRRVVSDKPLWFDHEVCGEGNAHVGIGKEIYYLSGDGLLMPAMKDQPPPDLRYFKKYDR